MKNKTKIIAKLLATSTLLVSQNALGVYTEQQYIQVANQLRNVQFELEHNNRPQAITELGRRTGYSEAVVSEILDELYPIDNQELEGQEAERQRLAAEAERASQQNLVEVSEKVVQAQKLTEHAKTIETPTQSSAIMAPKLHLRHVTNRLSNINIGKLGLSSGSEESGKNVGVWISGLYGFSKQGKIGSSSGYDGDVFGPTIGVDLDLNENNTIGAAYSYLMSKFDYKSQTKQKAKATTNSISLYSQSDIAEKLIWNNILSLSHSGVTSSRSLPSLSATGKAKFNASSASIESTFGYKIPVKTWTFIPTIGLRLENDHTRHC